MFIHSIFFLLFTGLVNTTIKGEMPVALKDEKHEIECDNNPAKDPYMKPHTAGNSYI